MPGKSPHAHERPAWHVPAQRPRTGRRPGGAVRPHPRGMSFCPSKAISHPVPKPRLRGLSRAMAPRPVPPHRGSPRERLSRPPRNARQKPPEGANRPPPTLKAPSKAACRKSARPFPWPAIPAAINERLFAPQKKRASPGRRRILPKANAPVPPHRGPPRKRLSRPPRNARQKPPGGNQPTASNARAAFSLSSPRLSRNTAANGHAPWEERAFRHQTRRLARRTLLSRAKSAQPGALGMPTNAKIALIYKNQVRFCFPGWRTFSTPGAPLTALPRAPRCRVRG